jgi:hypothetical protein
LILFNIFIEKPSLVSPRDYDSNKTPNYPTTRKNSEDASIKNKNSGILRTFTPRIKTADGYIVDEESKEHQNGVTGLYAKSNFKNAKNFLSKGSEVGIKKMDMDAFLELDNPDQASDMSIHLNYELISDKLYSNPPSSIGAKLTKTTTKNLKTVIQEDFDEDECSEEEKEACDKGRKCMFNTEGYRSTIYAIFLKILIWER